MDDVVFISVVEPSGLVVFGTAGLVKEDCFYRESVLELIVDFKDVRFVRDGWIAEAAPGMKVLFLVNCFLI